MCSKKEGGGVLIAVSRRIKSKRMSCWESKLEDLWVTIELPLSHMVRQIALCAVYLPPPVSRAMLEHFIDNCNATLENSTSHCIVGDFNLGTIDWGLYGDDSIAYNIPSLCQPLIDLLLINSLKQHNNNLNKSNRILDLVMPTYPLAL